ncbi:DUF6090 family protein [Ichthyenterobacterium sp. W332]|uniref:DUF6090 family protein n=1 Tax=Microcosmobacter mediterraneus TaxID=3075607 RepID=A0ABU2YJ37_9FLAO|nr:DUF6090 family protein [Ichthyenterobacterium sp. W332]MDT0558185.1 DUF6090 family protein [Ichthyenterobacterium sp. W332]
MIKFFRHIRKSLIEKKQMGKYFKYAIGEIILVVIGILIALQINNWNQQQKENVFERKVLNEILSDTEEDIKQMKIAIKSINESDLSYKYIINAFDKNLAYTDSMDTHFAYALRFWSLSPNSTAFETAKTEGLYFIKNDSIRFNLAKVNTYWYDYVKVLESRWQDYNTTIVQPYCLSLFDYYNLNKMKPTNYEKLKKDTTYKGILKSLKAMKIRYVETLNVRLNLVSELNEKLKDELDD